MPYISLTIIALTTALTIFSIFFNYDEDKPIKLSRFGWIAVGLTILLAILNLGVKSVEDSKQAEEKERIDSIRNVLIEKNNKLSILLKNFETKSISYFDSINNNITTNLDELKSTNNEIKKVFKSVKDVEANIQTKIYKENFGLKDKIKCNVHIRMPATEELINDIKEYASADTVTSMSLAKISNLNEGSYGSSILNIDGLFTDHIYISFATSEAKKNVGFIEGHSHSVDYRYIKNESGEYISWNAYFNLNVESSNLTMLSY